MLQLIDSNLGVSFRHRPASSRRRGTLLWVHGLGESGLCFEGLLRSPRLAAWEQIAIDLPGYGKSPWPAEPLSLVAHAELVARFIAEHCRDRPVVAGHSMGGVIVQLLAEEVTDRMRGLCNVEGNLSPGDCTFSSRAAAFERRAFDVRGFDELRLRVYDEGADDPALRTYFASLCFADPAAFHRNSLELVELSASEGLARRLASLPSPHCYVLGSPRGAAERSRELLRRAGVSPAVVEPAGHWPFLDQPDDFLDLLLTFLDTV